MSKTRIDDVTSLFSSWFDGSIENCSGVCNTVTFQARLFKKQGAFSYKITLYHQLCHVSGLGEIIFGDQEIENGEWRFFKNTLTRMDFNSQFSSNPSLG